MVSRKADEKNLALRSQFQRKKIFSNNLDHQWGKLHFMRYLKTPPGLPNLAVQRDLMGVICNHENWPFTFWKSRSFWTKVYFYPPPPDFEPKLQRVFFLMCMFKLELDVLSKRPLNTIIYLTKIIEIIRNYSDPLDRMMNYILGFIVLISASLILILIVHCFLNKMLPWRWWHWLHNIVISDNNSTTTRAKTTSGRTKTWLRTTAKK